MKRYSKMTAAVIDLAQKLDEVVAVKQPALAGVGGNIHFEGFGLDSSGKITKFGEDPDQTKISMVTLS